MAPRTPNVSKETWYDSFWVRFIIGGIIIAGSSELAVKVSPKAGAIFWSIPFSLIPTFLYFWSIRYPYTKIASFAKYTVVSLINMMAFVATVAIAMNYKRFQTPNGILYALLLGSLVWGIGSLILVYLD
jgi:hypothetical protein